MVHYACLLRNELQKLELSERLNGKSRHQHKRVQWTPQISEHGDHGLRARISHRNLGSEPKKLLTSLDYSPVRKHCTEMDEIASEYDVVVLGTGVICRMEEKHHMQSANVLPGLTECILSGYSAYWPGTS
jgi:hypothetical protein